jgi:hypothetical protein
MPRRSNLSKDKKMNSKNIVFFGAKCVIDGFCACHVQASHITTSHITSWKIVFLGRASQEKEQKPLDQ